LAQTHSLFFLPAPTSQSGRRTALLGNQSNHKMLWAGGLSYFPESPLSSVIESFFLTANPI
jgi:hypothetical protein